MRPTHRIRLNSCAERPFRSSVLPRRILAPRPKLPGFKRRHSIKASNEESSSRGQTPKWNPFKKDTSKQEAAERALRDAMGDRKDVLAQFDSSDDDDGSNGGGSGGGWNWSWNWDDWKNNFGEFGQLLLKWLSGIGQTLKAIIACALIIFAVSMIGPALSAASKFIRVLLRLETVEDAYGRGDEQPAGMQRSVLFSDDEEEEASPPLSEAARRRKERRESQKLDKKEKEAAASKKS